MLETKVAGKKIDTDSTKLIYHPGREEEWLQKGDCFPIYVELGVTDKCNHRCTFCALDWVKKGHNDIDPEIMTSAIKDMASHGVRSVMFGGEGEPIIHREFPNFVRTAGESKLVTTLTMNGVLFKKGLAEKCLPYLCWARFSVDAGTPQTYSQVHRTSEHDFQIVLDNIQTSAAIKKEKNLDVSISVQYLLIPSNLSEVIALTNLVKEAGADNIQIKPYSQHPLSKNKFSLDYSQLTKAGEQLNKLNTDSFKVIFRETAMQMLHEKPTYEFCHGLPFFALVDSRGNVIPCNLFYDNPDFVYGSLYSQSFSEIWKSGQRKAVLERIKTRGIESCRGGCRLDASNRHLERLLHPEKADDVL